LVSNIGGWYNIVMDFSTLDNAKKKTLFALRITEQEAQVWADSWVCGIDPADLSSSYTAPADEPADTEIRLESGLAVLVAMKSQEAAL